MCAKLTCRSFRGKVSHVEVGVVVKFVQRWLQLKKNVMQPLKIMRINIVSLTVTTCDCMVAVFSLGPTSVSVLATLNLTLATESLAIVSTVGSIRRSVISVPQASAKICRG